MSAQGPRQGAINVGISKHAIINKALSSRFNWLSGSIQSHVWECAMTVPRPTFTVYITMPAREPKTASGSILGCTITAFATTSQYHGLMEHPGKSMEAKWEWWRLTGASLLVYPVSFDVHQAITSWTEGRRLVTRPHHPIRFHLPANALKWEDSQGRERKLLTFDSRKSRL